MTVERLNTDILILGSGGAGLFAALHAFKANPDLDVTIATKGLLGKCGCTRMVQGGYNVALNPGDSVERHFMDTIEGGKWLPHQELAWTLVSAAVERVRELENEIGCFFDRNPDGTLHGKAFAGQSFDRTVHKGDLTGIEIINRLMEQVWARPIRRLEEHRAVALIPATDGVLAGVLMIDIRTGAFCFVAAQAVLLATGGGPTMYRYHTPSGDKSMDGLAMGLRAGLPLRDMEMVQFHPTGLLAGADTRMTGTVPAQAAASTVRIREFPIPTANSGAFNITAGPDGKVWFVEVDANNIGRITPGGAITEFPIPTANSQSFGITAGPDGAVWFTESAANKIGRITTRGSFTEFLIPTADSFPIGITTGPDENLWFTEVGANQIGRLTPGDQ